MNAHRHQRIKEIFGELCERPPAQRAARLETLGADDPDLAHDVEILLKHSDTPAFDIEDVEQLSSLVGDLARGPIIDVPRPLHIGMYDVLDQLGQGGMGVVYLAQQHKPLERQVAIKVIRPGMDTRHVLQRFDVERRTLAAMNHPGIASIHDAGVTEEGRPYFVMQFVHGERITTYCDTHRLSIDARLALFLDVCDAVVHAHQKGIIHRDLKPSNILIEERNGKAVPTVIDFGVAKAMGTSIAEEETLHTAPGQLLGTPQYMSPEQTELSGMHVDTRSDVYSLGALLYELLCGTTPIDVETIRSASFDQVCKMIRESEPAAPSRRAEQLDAHTGAQAAQQRSTTRHDLARTLRGELDWITRTAMEKDPQRRYESVSALAADIARYQRHEPVVAGPVSATYRLRKFVRRHRGAVIASTALLSLLLLLMLTIVVGGTAFMMQAAKTAREADNNQQIVDFMDNLFATANPYQGSGGDTTLREFMEHASERLNNNPDLPNEVRSSLHNTIGATFASLGDYESAEPHFRAAWTLRQQTHGSVDHLTLRAAGNLVHTLQKLDRLDEAVAIGRKWLPVAEEVLGPEAIETRMFTTNLALAEDAIGNLDEAERLYQLSLERDRAANEPVPRYLLSSLANLGVFYIDHQRIDEGEQLLHECLDLTKQYYKDEHPQTLFVLGSLAALRQRQGDLDGAYDMMTSLVEVSRRMLGNTHPETLGRIANLSIVMLKRGQFADAETLLQPAYDEAVQERGYADTPTIHIAEMLTTSIAYQDRLEEATNLALDLHTHVLTELGEDHPRTKRAALLVANCYDSWQKPAQYREWLVKAGETAPTD